MKTVNLGLPFDKHINLRMNARQMDHVVSMSQEFNISPSEYVRLLIDDNIKKLEVLHNGDPA